MTKAKQNYFTRSDMSDSTLNLNAHHASCSTNEQLVLSNKPIKRKHTKAVCLSMSKQTDELHSDVFSGHSLGDFLLLCVMHSVGSGLKTAAEI